MDTTLFTVCPSCLKQFRVQAADLSLASGVVCCGVCGKQFNALSSLSDRPLSHAKQQHRTQSVAGSVKTGSVKTGSAKTGSVKTDTLSLMPLPQDSVHDDLEVELLEQLRAAKSLHRSRFATVFWIIGIVALFLMLLVQVLWFNRDFVLQRYPQSFLFAKAICQKFDCDVLRYKDVSAIQLVQRNIVYYSNYPDRLNINAKILNNSDNAQAFPNVHLALFDTLGKVIAYGEFKPEDYVRGDVDIDFGMQPRGRADFVLALYGAPIDATSFEFLFL